MQKLFQIGRSRQSIDTHHQQQHYHEPHKPQRNAWSSLNSERFGNKSLRRLSVTSQSIQIVRGAYNIDLNKVDSSFTKLHRACLRNDVASVRRYVQKIDPNQVDNCKRAPIHLATVNGNIEIVRLLLEHGARVNCRDADGRTPLVKSIECGHTDLMQFLLKETDADPNMPDFELGNTAAHWAIASQSIEMSNALIQSKRCNFNLVNNEQDSCLHLAARWTNTFIDNLLSAMIEQGADLNALNADGATAYEVACNVDNQFAIATLTTDPSTQVTNIDDNHMNVPLGQYRDQHQQLSSSTLGGLSEMEREMANNLSETHAETKRLCDEFRRKFDQKNRDNCELEKKLIHLESQSKHLHIDISSIEEHNRELQAQLARIKQQQESDRQELRRLTTDVHRLRTENVILRRERQQLAADLAKIKVLLQFNHIQESDQQTEGAGPTHSPLPDSFQVAKDRLQCEINRLRIELSAEP